MQSRNYDHPQAGEEEATEADPENAGISLAFRHTGLNSGLVGHIGHDAGPAEGEGDDNELGLEEEGVMFPDVYHSRKVVSEV